MKLAVVCQSLSKFIMFSFVVLHTMPFIVFSFLNGGGNKIFGFLVGEQKRGGQLSKLGGWRTTL